MLRASHESSRDVLQVRAGLVPRKTERDCWLRARTCADDTGIARGRDCQCANHERSGEQRARPYRPERPKGYVSPFERRRCDWVSLLNLRRALPCPSPLCTRLRGARARFTVI